MRNLALFILFSVGILSVAEVAVLVTTVSPSAATHQELWAFFLSFGLALASWGSLLWHGFRSRVIYRINKPSLWASVRQSILFSLVVTLVLFFNSLGIFSPWDIIPLILAAILIEFFFQADKTPAS